MWHFIGFNGFNQFGKEHASKINKLTNFNLQSVNDEFLITPAWSFNVMAFGSEILISGFFNSNRKAHEKIQLPDKIKNVGSTDNYCLVLLVSGKLLKLSRKDLGMEEIKFSPFVTKTSLKRKSEELSEYTICKTVVVEHIACGSNFAVASTSDNCVYNIPTIIAKFPETEQIVALECGFEHVIMLNSYGDVYTLGNGIRGQLGIEELRIEKKLILVKALDNIKIISIAAGGWHSAAASLSGDIYMWGLNSSGQLGVRLFNANGIKNTQVYPLPQLVNLPHCFVCEKKQIACKIIAVHCGARHSMARTECGSILAAGWNKYGQLALAGDRSIVDRWEKIYDFPNNDAKIICGPWCTIFKFKH